MVDIRLLWQCSWRMGVVISPQVAQDLLGRLERDKEIFCLYSPLHWTGDLFSLEGYASLNY